MPDPTAMLQEFGKYLEWVEIKGRKPSEQDVDNFMERFLSNLSYGFSLEGGQYIQSAYKRMPDGSYLYPISSYKEAVKEIKPILMARILEAHGRVSEHYEAENWDTKPMTVDEYALFYAKELGQEDSYLEKKGRDRRNHPAYQKAVKHLLKVKYRINLYMKKVLPFTLRSTMHHPLGIVTYSTTQGPNKKIAQTTTDGEPFSIDSEKKLNDFMNSESIDGVPAALDAEIRSVFWTPSITGRGLKMGIININNPANLPHKVLMSSVKKIYRMMEFKLGHPCIIMFTGNSYQIWFGMNEREEIPNFKEMQDYLKLSLYTIGAFDEDTARSELLPFLDIKANAPNQMTRTFFSLHYPSTDKPDKEYTGLAAIPIAPTDLDSFNPAKDAHPEQVLANFDIYSSYVAAFYDKVQIGQDYAVDGEIEATPSCSRLPTQHKDAKALKAIYKPDELIQVQYRNIATMLEDEEKVYAHPIARGVLAVLVYDPKGTSAPPGMKTQRSRRGRVVTETPKSYYVLSNGVVIYDDYICRDLERVCIANKIKQAILVGRISMIDSYGNEEGENETRNALIRTEGISPMDARVMRFTINRASAVNSEKIPIEMMNEQMQVFSAKRIVPSTYFEYTKPVGLKLKQRFMDLVRTRASGAMMVEGEEKYLIKSTRTLNATIIAMDTTGKAYRTNEIPNVLIALAKPSSKYGAEYISVAKAQIALKKEDRITLRMLVEGENQQKVIPAPRGIPEGVAVFTEASVVVEVAYDDVTPQKYDNITMSFRSDGSFRATTNAKASNRLINAKVIGIKEDLDFRKPSHINVRQEELIEVSSTTSKQDSLLDTLPNPGGILPQFIRRNPAFFGVPDKLTTYVGGVPDDQGYMTGGRRVEIPLLKKGPIYLGERLPGELEASYDRYRKDEEGFKTFVDVNSLVQTETPPNYRITDLGWEYHTARDDVYGGGQDANKITSMDGNLSPIKSYGEVMNMVHFEGNKAQALEDSKVYGSTFNEVAGRADTEESDRRSYDTAYRAAFALVDKQLKASLDPVKLGKEEQQALTKEILSNPNHSLAEDFERMKQAAYDVRTKETLGEEVNGREWWNQQIPWIEERYGTEPLEVTWAIPLETEGFDPHDKTQEFDSDGKVLPLHFLNQLKRIPMIKEPTPERIMQIALNIGQGQASGSVETDFTLDDFIIRQNPPVKSDIWQSKVDLYTEEFNKWAALPEPKEGWENYAIGMFVTWEVPLLEKERLLRAAKDKYELTAEEVDMIDSQYADAPTEELFDLILSDLYEVPTYDAEVEESII